MPCFAKDLSHAARRVRRMRCEDTALPFVLKHFPVSFVPKSMKFSAPLRHSVGLFAFLLVFTCSANAWTARQFEAPPTLSKEVRSLIGLLEQVHYNHENVHPSDYSQVIPDYMGELDGMKLFFLATDKEELMKKYPANWIYNNISSLGRIDPAYDIYNLYATRAEARIQWIFEVLKQDIDLTAKETYQFDRSKAEWCATSADADALWHKRLKFEILQDVLNKKSIDEAKQNVRKRYERALKNLEDFEADDITEMYLSTITRMYDPHSTYFSPSTFDDFGIQMRLQLVGIGALLGLEDEYCVVKEIVAGGPADVNKQLQPNDKILFVAQGDNEPVEVIGMKLRKIVNMIRGDKGTKVRLIVQPAAATDPSARKEIVLNRDVINLDSARARGAIFDLPDPATGKTLPIGVITLPAFYGPDSSSNGEDKNSATKDVAELIKQLQKAGITGLVLDLRQNGGGLLSEAIDLTGLFISKGPVVQVRSYYGDVKVDSDENPDIAYSGPLAVLVSRFSASASEIVAGALQDYGRAVIVGDSSTHGKGSVQTVIEMKNVLSDMGIPVDKTGATKLTIQKFYLPDGHSTQLKGVISDIVLPSLDEYLPIGESDLPHALPWDEITSSRYEGGRIDAKFLNNLRESSTARQTKLEEFSFLKKNIEWFKNRQETKTVSLNLEERRAQKASDSAFKKTMEKEKEQLAKNSYPFREFKLGNAPTKKPPEKKPADSDDDDAELSLINDEGYARFDPHLRETMRILSDAIKLGQKANFANGEHVPLTARVAEKS
jgi:carboxyl-terminal processing protease